MRKLSVLVINILLVLLFTNLSSDAQSARLETWQGKLVVGKLDSAIIYYGSESGDMAAFCFRNKSSVGREVLSKCKNGKQCKFKGKLLDEGSLCSTASKILDGFKRNFSYTAQIVSLKSVRQIDEK